MAGIEIIGGCLDPRSEKARADAAKQQEDGRTAAWNSGNSSNLAAKKAPSDAVKSSVALSDLSENFGKMGMCTAEHGLLTLAAIQANPAFTPTDRLLETSTTKIRVGENVEEVVNPSALGVVARDANRHIPRITSTVKSLAEKVKDGSESVASTVARTLYLLDVEIGAAGIEAAKQSAALLSVLRSNAQNPIAGQNLGTMSAVAGDIRLPARVAESFKNLTEFLKTTTLDSDESKNRFVELASRAALTVGQYRDDIAAVATPK